MKVDDLLFENEKIEKRFTLFSGELLILENRILIFKKLDERICINSFLKEEIDLVEMLVDSDGCEINIFLTNAKEELCVSLPTDVSVDLHKCLVRIISDVKGVKLLKCNSIL